MTKQELQNLREGIQAIRRTKKRHEALKAQRSGLDSETYARTNEEIHSEHALAAEQVEPLREKAHAERGDIDEEQQQVNEWLEQVTRRESDIDTMAESDAMDSSEARAEKKRLSRKRSEYRKRLAELEKQRGVLDAALAGEKPDKASGNIAAAGRGSRKLKVALLAVGAVAVVVAVTAIIAVNIVNNQAEAQVRQNLDDFIAAQNMEELFNYGDVQVHSARGRLVFSDIEFSSPAAEEFRLRADELSVSISPLEAIALASDPGTATVSGFGIAGTGLRVQDNRGGSGLEVGELTVSVGGEFSQASLSQPESMHFSDVEIAGTDARFEEPESGMQGELGSFEYTMAGRITPATMEADPGRFLSELESMTIDLGGGSLRLGDEQQQELSMMLGNGSWLADADNWRFDQFAMDTTFSPEEIASSSVALSSPLTTLEGSWSVQMDADFEPSKIDMNVSVEELHRDLREGFGMMFAIMGAQLPESGPFSFEFSATPDGQPSITVE